MQHLPALWSQDFSHMLALSDLWICSSTGTLTSDQPLVMVDSHVISCLGLVGSYLHGMQEKNPRPHQSVCQPREVIDWVHITLWTLQRASAAKPYRSATLYIIVPDAPWSGTVCCPASSIRAAQFGLFLKWDQFLSLWLGKCWRITQILLLTESDDLLRAIGIYGTLCSLWKVAL